MEKAQELAFGLLLLSCLSVAVGDLKLDVVDYNSTFIGFSCKYLGNQKIGYIKILQDKKACIDYSDHECKPYGRNNCDVLCRDSNDPKIVMFFVNLADGCDVNFFVRCVVYSSTGPKLQEISFPITAQSDPPKVEVNNGKPVRADGRPVKLVCEVTNRCTKNDIEILGDVHKRPIKMNHFKEGNRFRTTAETTVTFSDPGEFFISCKETGKEDHYGTNISVTVHSVEVGTKITEKPDTEAGTVERHDSHEKTAGKLTGDERAESHETSFEWNPWIIAVIVLVIIVVILVIIIIWQRRKQDNRTDYGNVVVYEQSNDCTMSSEAIDSGRPKKNYLQVKQSEGSDLDKDGPRSDEDEPESNMDQDVHTQKEEDPLNVGYQLSGKDSTSDTAVQKETEVN